MSHISIDAGKLDQRLEVLELKFSGKQWSWQPIRKTRANVTMSTRSNLFSSVGIGARGAELILRQQELTLNHALRWVEQHLFLASILPEGRLHWKVSAAVVAPVTCTAARTEDTVGEAGRPVTGEVMRLTFPGVLTEKYTRYEREADHGETDTGYVLVTPKPIALKTGDLVTIQDGQAPGTYHVTVCHMLDEFKNEYEIAHREDA